MRYHKPRKLPPEATVSIVAAAYINGDPRLAAALECFVQSMRAQTWPHWKLTIVHDGPMAGPDESYLMERVCVDRDLRVSAIVTNQRKHHHGHPWRDYGIAGTTGRYVGLQNADNYLVPVYLELLLDALVNQDADLAFCDFVHSHTNWQPFRTSPQKRKIDLGCWLANGDLVRSTPWPGNHFNSDGDFVAALVAKSKKVVKVPQTLFVHN